MARQQKKPTDAPNGNGGSIKELLDELWEAAVRLRGSIEPADYKRWTCRSSTTSSSRRSRTGPGKTSG